MDVGAAPDPAGVRVYFRRTEPGTGGAPAHLRAKHGLLTDIVHAPDGLGISALWTNAAGELRCEFPYGGEAVYRAGGPMNDDLARYVYLHTKEVRVTGRVAQGCPLRSAIELRVEPATATIEDLEDNRFRPPRDKQGKLKRGVYKLVVAVDGKRLPFLVGIDADGVPAAVSGYVENW